MRHCIASRTFAAPKGRPHGTSRTVRSAYTQPLDTAKIRGHAPFFLSLTRRIRLFYWAPLTEHAAASPSALRRFRELAVNIHTSISRDLRMLEVGGRAVSHTSFHARWQRSSLISVTCGKPLARFRELAVNIYTSISRDLRMLEVGGRAGVPAVSHTLFHARWQRSSLISVKMWETVSPVSCASQ